MEEEFDDWFYELEGYSFRSERFCDDLERGDPREMIKWLQTAYEMGYNAGQQHNGELSDQTN